MTVQQREPPAQASRNRRRQAAVTAALLLICIPLVLYNLYIDLHDTEPRMLYEQVSQFLYLVAISAWMLLKNTDNANMLHSRIRHPVIVSCLSLSIVLLMIGTFLRLR